MRLIPEVKEKIQGEKIEVKGYTFNLPKDCDERVVTLSKKAPKGDTVVNVKIGDCGCDDYSIKFGDTVEVDAKGVKGAKGGKGAKGKKGKKGAKGKKGILLLPYIVSLPMLLPLWIFWAFNIASLSYIVSLPLFVVFESKTMLL